MGEFVGRTQSKKKKEKPEKVKKEKAPKEPKPEKPKKEKAPKEPKPEKVKKEKAPKEPKPEKVKKEKAPKAPKSEKEKASLTHRILTVIGIVLCVILIPLLISNIVLIIQSYTNKDKVPSLFSISPMIVMTDSMKSKINGGDLIFIKKTAAEDIELEDIVAFFDPASSSNSVVTHRIKEIITDEEGNISFRTAGDANGGALDDVAVPADKIIGRYTFRLRGIGSLALFMQSTPGLIICVILPLFLLIAYDVIRRRMYEKKKQTEQDALLAELAALKAEKALSGTDAAPTDAPEAENPAPEETGEAEAPSESEAPAEEAPAAETPQDAGDDDLFADLK